MVLSLILCLCLQEKTAEKLLEELRSESVEDRERAAAALRKMGEAARAGLEKASRDKDREVAARALEILEPLNRGIGAEALRKLEEKVAKAASARIRFRFEGSGPKAELGGGKGSGTLLLKGKGMRLEMTFMLLEEEHRMLVLSDGKRVSASVDSGPANTFDLPQELPPYAFLMVRGGMVVLASRRLQPGEKEVLPAEGMRLGDAGDEGKTLIYTVKLSANGDTADIKVWYDPERLAIKRRSVAIRREGQPPVLFSETYEEFALDPELSDDLFKVPAAEKR